MEVQGHKTIIYILYRVNTYLTIRGVVKFIDLGDFSYGEWIVFENGKPKYHIKAFDDKAISNTLINRLLLNKKKETFESIIDKISKNQRLKLSLDNRPFIRIRLRSALENVNLTPLPDHFLKNI